MLDEGVSVFKTGAAREQREQAAGQGELNGQIGRLKMELEWLKGNWLDDTRAKRAMIEPKHTELSIHRQCELTGLNRATFYYAPAQESCLNLLLMRLIDEQYTRTPFYGWPRMTVHLRRQGAEVHLGGWGVSTARCPSNRSHISWSFCGLDQGGNLTLN